MMKTNHIHPGNERGSKSRCKRLSRRQRICIGLFGSGIVLLSLALGLILGLIVFKSEDSEEEMNMTTVFNYSAVTSSVSSVPIQTISSTLTTKQSETIITSRFVSSNSQTSACKTSSSTSRTSSTTTLTTTMSSTFTTTTTSSTSTMTTTPTSTTTSSATTMTTTPTSTTTSSSTTVTTTMTITSSAITTSSSTTTSPEVSTSVHTSSSTSSAEETSSVSTASSSTTATSSTTTLNPYTSCKNNFTLIHFDDLPGVEQDIPAGYHGLNWTNAGAFNVSKYNISGYHTVLTSAPNVAYNGGGNQMTIAVGPSASVKSFSLQSLIVAAAWENNLRVSMTGFRASAAIYNRTIILQTTTKQFLSLDWNNINRMTITTTAGVSAGYGHNGSHVGIDNMCLLTSKT